MSPASAEQIKAIHALKARAGLDEASYRDFLDRAAGVRSAKGLTLASAGAVIEELKGLTGQKQTSSRTGPGQTPPKAKGALRLSGPYVGICRALWISGYELGVFEHREDTALVAFVRRQTGLDSLNWLRDADQARGVIEALKKWISRVAGVAWPGRSGTPAETKQAVIRAQQRALGEIECVVQGDLDAAIKRYGTRLRALRGGSAP